MLANSDLETLRRELETQRSVLLQTIGGDQTEALIEDNPDEEDLADFIVQHEIRLSLDQFSTEMLVRIDGALARLKDGTYGECQNCRGEIPTERLQALPYAEMCVTCQSRLEKRIHRIQ